jgi:FkbM family methyltransferase
MKKLFDLIFKKLYKLHLFKIIIDRIIINIFNNTFVIYHNSTKILLHIPNKLSYWRAKTYSTKEPETLEWIDDMQHGKTLWDIGANIGLYSIYGALKKGLKVYSFEPSVFNLELLARNIYTNKVVDNCCIVPLALNNKISSSNLNMTSTEWGGALSTFDSNFGWDGNSMKPIFQFQTIGISIDQCTKILQIPTPNYIKIDVDGLEHLILSGGLEVLKNIDEILIEINDNFKVQSEQCNLILTNAGLKLYKKAHSNIYDNLDGFNHSYNQIWKR